MTALFRGFRRRRMKTHHGTRLALSINLLFDWSVGVSRGICDEKTWHTADTPFLPRKRQNVDAFKTRLFTLLSAVCV